MHTSFGPKFNTLKRRTKAALKAILPPILVWSVKRILGGARRTSARKSITISKRKPDRLLINDSLWFYHRDVGADLGVIQQILINEDYSLKWMARFPEIQRTYEACREPLIIDCGANIGASVGWFKLNYPRSRVIAVEPEANNFELLEKNAQALDNVTLIRGAIAGEAGSVPLLDHGTGEWGYRADRKATGEAIDHIRGYTIQDLVNLQEGTPFILKLDIEGAETEAFQSWHATFDRFPLIIVELHDWKYPKEATSRSFLQWHSQVDRDFLYRGENIFSISNKI